VSEVRSGTHLPITAITDAWAPCGPLPPPPGALTAVAATTVLGPRFSVLGWQALAEALPALAALPWPALVVQVVQVVGHRKQRMPGAVFLACVATQGIAVLGATLAAAEAVAEPVAWLARAALVPSLLRTPGQVPLWIAVAARPAAAAGAVASLRSTAPR
jgi:hypothetical protein